MKLVFCGTPMFAVPSLERLAAAGFEIQLVVTQPDRPQGRGMTLTAPPVKQSALKLGLPVIQPEKIRKNEEFQAALTAIHRASCTSATMQAISTVKHRTSSPRGWSKLPDLQGDPEFGQVVASRVTSSSSLTLSGIIIRTA